jgi:hypothetical protein
MSDYTDEQINAMADRLAKLDAYGCCRDGAIMLRKLVEERLMAAESCCGNPYWSE